MISSVEWVPQGAADPTPKKYEMSPAELELLEKQAELEAALDNEDDFEDDDDDDDSYDNEAENPTTKSSKISLPPVDPKSLPADLRMDDYSDDDDDNDALKGSHIGNLLVGKETDAEMLLEAEEEAHQDDDGKNDKKNSNYDVDSDDDSDDDLADVPDTREYMPVDVEGLESMGLSHAAGVLNDLADNDDDDDNASDIDDINLNPDDAMICVAKTEEDFASLEVHVYEQKSGNLFVHHDIPLPSFPLCLAHGDVNADGGVGNYCAVGTFSPGIEIWNLDILNPLEPMCVLGGEDTTAADELMKLNMMRAASGKKLKKNKKSGNFGTPGGLKPGSHTDAVMALAWNKIHRQVIASGSGDCTVKLWDITQASSSKEDKCCASTFQHHTDKVQSLAWHPTEGTLLATGGFDRTVALVDARSADSIKKVKLPADCEALAWDPYNPQCLTAASEDGTLMSWDVRKFDTRTPLWSFVANEYGGVSDLSYNPSVPGMMVTCATDKTVTLWDTQNSVSGDNVIAPHPCGNKDMGVGKLYTVSFYPSSPWLLGCAGAGNELSLWDLREEMPVQNRFQDRVSEAAKQQQEQQQNNDVEQQEGNNMNDNKEQNFEAMMAAGDAATEKARTKAKKKNKKGKKKKDKVHRKGA